MEERNSLTLVLFFPDRLLAEFVCGTVHLGNAGPAWGSVAWLAGRGVPLTLPGKGNGRGAQGVQPETSEMAVWGSLCDR